MVSSDIRILIIDGNDAVRQALVVRLDHLAGVDLIASTGNDEQALNLASTLRPDVILLEPKTDAYAGLALCKRLLEVAPESCLVIYTSYQDPDEKATVLDAGVDDYLLKTIDLHTLVDALQRLKAQPRSNSPH